MTVENALIYCPTNTSCNAECYRGFIFTTVKLIGHSVVRKVYGHPCYRHAKVSSIFVKYDEAKIMYACVLKVI